MPYLMTKINTALPEEKERALAEKFCDAISLIPGKAPEQLMMDFSDNCRMHFRGAGQQPPMAYLELKILGSADAAAFGAFSDAAVRALGEVLAVSPENVYVKFEEIRCWGTGNGVIAAD